MSIAGRRNRGGKKVATSFMPSVSEATLRTKEKGSIRYWQVLDLKYSLVIEATSDRTCFCFSSPRLKGFTGTGRSLEDCIRKASSRMKELDELLREVGLPVPSPEPNPSVLIKNQTGDTVCLKTLPRRGPAAPRRGLRLVG